MGHRDVQQNRAKTNIYFTEYLIYETTFVYLVSATAALYLCLMKTFLCTGVGRPYEK